MTDHGERKLFSPWTDPVETDSDSPADPPVSTLFINSGDLLYDDDDNQNLVDVSIGPNANRIANPGRPWPTTRPMPKRCSVSRARLRRGSIPVAVKKVHNFKEEEIKKLVSLSHENVVRFIGAVKEDVINVVVMEFLAGGNLYEHLAKNREEGKCLLLGRCLNWAKQCARGLKYLHDISIVHKNIQSYNYLLNSVDVTNCILKLCNFGLTKPEHTAQSVFTTWHGSSMAWRAPEVINDPTFSKKQSDNFSLGVVIWELLTCKKPWHELNDREISETVRHGRQHLHIPEDCPIKLKTLLEKCWQTERACRPKISDICETLECLGKDGNLYELEPNCPEMKLRMGDMSEIASCLKKKSQWREFAVSHLCIHRDDCDDLEKEEPDQLVYAVLRKWLMREGEKGTVGTLAKHLKDFHQFDPLGYKFLCELSPP